MVCGCLHLVKTPQVFFFFFFYDYDLVGGWTSGPWLLSRVDWGGPLSSVVSLFLLRLSNPSFSTRPCWTLGHRFLGQSKVIGPFLR